MATDPDSEFRKRLASEIQAWREEGLIDENQAQALLARQGARPGRLLAAIRLGLVITVLSVIGAVAVGAGVLLFVSANWKAGEDIPSFLKTGLLFGGIGLCYYGGYLLQFRFAVQPRVGAAIILLGALLFQGAIFLLEQIYNMPVDDPIGLLLGAIGILPLAYLMGSRFVLFLGLVDLVAWVGWQVGSSHLEDPEMLAPILALLLIGVLLYTLGLLHERWPLLARFSGIYAGLGVVVTLSIIFFVSFEWFWEEIRDDFPCPAGDTLRYYSCTGRDHSGYGPATEVLILLGVTTVVALAGIVMRGLRSLEVRVEALLLLAAIILIGIAAIRPWYPLAVPFNLLFFAAALGFIWRGYMQADNKFIYGGLAAIAIGLFARYCETSWGLLPRSGFFFLGGVLLLALAAAVEMARRRMLAHPNDGQR